MPTTVNELFRVEEATSFADQELPESGDSLWGDGLLDRGSRLAISGIHKIGKSLFAEAMAISFASGQKFLGFAVPHRLKVLYINLEVSRKQLHKRFNLMFAHRRPEAGYLYQCSMARLYIAQQEYFNGLRGLIQEHRFDVIIFDPFYKIHNADENSSKEMSQVLGWLDELIAEFGIAVVIVHHHGKSDTDNTKAVRGSSTIIDWVDSALRMKRDNKDKIWVNFTQRRPRRNTYYTEQSAMV